MTSDHSDFQQFATSRWRPLLRTAVAMGFDRHDAEDLAQTTLIKAYVKWSSIKKSHDPQAYVAKILINAGRDLRRQRSRQPTTSLNETIQCPTGRGELDRVEQSLDLLRGLSGLSHDQRQIVALRFYFDMSEKQIADTLGIQAGTVKSRHSRAMTKLRNHLERASEGAER